MFTDIIQDLKDLNVINIALHLASHEESRIKVFTDLSEVESWFASEEAEELEEAFDDEGQWWWSATATSIGRGQVTHWKGWSDEGGYARWEKLSFDRRLY